jgi:putative membrane protein
MRRTILRTAALLTVLAVAPVWLARAQTGKGEQEFQGLTDAQFVKIATAMDLAEVSLARLAEQNANTDGVRAYGKKLLSDHMKASKELLMLADKARLQPASQMDAKHEAALEKLARLKGEAFDQAFVMHMIHDHHTAIALYKSQAKNGKDASLKAFAEKSVPVLQEHLKMAERLSGKGAGGGTTKGQ